MLRRSSTSYERREAKLAISDGHILRYLRDGDPENGDDASRALHDALQGNVEVDVRPIDRNEPIRWAIGDVQLVSNRRIVGLAGPHKASSTTPMLVQFRKPSGATHVLKAGGTNGVHIEGVGINGVDSTGSGIDVSGGSAEGLSLNWVDARYCNIGIGGTGQIATSNICHVRASANGLRESDNAQVSGATGNGIQRLVDTRVVDVRTSGNKGRGLNLSTGDNANTISQFRAEYNGGRGISITGAEDIVIMAYEADRNGGAALFVGTDSSSGIRESQVSVVGMWSYRNGWDSDSAHIVWSRHCRLDITGILTKHGVGDGGVLPDSPSYIFDTQSGGAGIFHIEGCLDGYTVQIGNGSAPDNFTRIDKTRSAIDREYASGVRLWKQRIQEFSTSAASGATAAITVTLLPSVDINSTRIYEFDVAYRNQAVGANDYGAKVMILVQREGGNATVALSDPFGVVGTAGAISTTAAGTVADLTVSCNADASEITISSENVSANGHNIFLRYHYGE